MAGWKTWAWIGGALIVGVAGGQAWTRVGAGDEIPLGGEALARIAERIESIDERLVAIEGGLSAGHGRLRPHAKEGRQEGPAERSNEAPSAFSMAEEIDRVQSQLSELLDASLCRSPEALAEAEDRAKLERADNADAVEEGWRILRYARNRGRWTEADAADLRETLPRLTRGQQSELLEILLPALQQELEVDFFPPF